MKFKKTERLSFVNFWNLATSLKIRFAKDSQESCPEVFSESIICGWLLFFQQNILQTLYFILKQAFCSSSSHKENFTCVLSHGKDGGQRIHQNGGFLYNFGKCIFSKSVFVFVKTSVNYLFDLIFFHLGNVTVNSGLYPYNNKNIWNCWDFRFVNTEGWFYSFCENFN